MIHYGRAPFLDRFPSSRVPSYPRHKGPLTSEVVETFDATQVEVVRSLERRILDQCRAGHLDKSAYLTLSP